jgi:alkylation response protein AidB-like acyl-CoA dehydrogenase
MTTTGEALRGQKVDFSFSDEQVLLRDTIGKYMAAEYDSATRKRIVASPEGHSRETWKQFAELGFLAAPFVEEYGGLGGSAVETMIIMEECGRRVVVEPFIETVVLAGGLLRDLGSEDQRRAFLPRIIDGSDLWALAWRRHRAGTIFTTSRCVPTGTVMATG